MGNKPIYTKRYSYRKIHHMCEHLDATAGALERKDIKEAKTYLNFARTIANKFLKRETDGVVRSTDNG